MAPCFFFQVTSSTKQHCACICYSCCFILPIIIMKPGFNVQILGVLMPVHCLHYIAKESARAMLGNKPEFSQDLYISMSGLIKLRLIVVNMISDPNPT